MSDSIFDLTNDAGARVEYGIPVDAEVEDLNATRPERIQFLSEELAHEGPGDGRGWVEPVWTRVVGPWRQLDSGRRDAT